jgi:hypothetical protein
MTPPRIPRPLKIIAGVYAIYLALVMLVATPVFNIFAPKIYRAQTGRELHIEKIIWVNPFTLSVTARNAGSNNADGSRFWAADGLTVNLSLASIWRRHIVLDALELRGLYLQIDQTAADHYNYSDILDYRAKQTPTATVPAETERQNEVVAIDIDKITVSAAHLGYRAPYANQPLAATISDLSFTLTDFSTVPERSNNTPPPKKPAALPALRANNFALALKTIELNFLRAQQPFSTRLQNLKVIAAALSTTATADQSYELDVLDASGGEAQLKGAVVFDRQSANGSLHLRNIDLRPAWQYLADKLAFEAQRAQLDGDINYAVSWGETLHYTLDNSQLALRDVQLQSRQDGETQVGFSALRVDGVHVDSAQPRAQIGKVLLDKPSIQGWNHDTSVSLIDMFAFASSPEPSTAPPWQIQIDDIVTQGGEVHWRASQLEALPLTLAPLDIHASNLHWPDAAPLQIDLKTLLNNEAKIAVNGTLVPAEKNGQVSGDIGNVPIAWGNQFLQQQMRAMLVSGILNTHFELKLENAQPALLQSDGAIDQFELQSLPDKRKLVAWNKLQWKQLTLENSKRRIAAKQVVVTQPWLQFRINTDGTNNIQQLLVKSDTAAPVKTTKTTASTTKTGASAVQKPWQFAVDNIHIDKATLDFRDASLTSAFRTNINELTGNIDGLDNSSKKPAKVALKGTVDGYAPVALTGTVSPFTNKPAADITLDITNLDLATLTPYSGTYAGYQIDGGRLTVQLAYKLDNNRIRGTNHIIVNQMQLGKQVSGPKVMDLPLRFAIYLLTDANGVMDLGVDVTGNVDDPNFSVGSIIWKAFRNVIVKTVTSPFRALANLAGAGGRDDLDRVEFHPGDDKIAAAETEKLQTLNNALQKKSALKLSITGHVSPSQDIEALRDNTLSQQLITQGGIDQKDIQQQSKNWQREVVKLFKKRFPNEKTELQVMQMNDAMRDNIELAPGALQELAAHRALAVKQMLVADLGLAADRAFVKPVDLGADKYPGLQTTLEVE